MSIVRLPVSMLSISAALLAVIIGCSHPLEVDVPAGYTGKVTVFCNRLAEVNQPIKVGADGAAPNAVCPRSRATLTIVRAGQPIQPAGEPH